MIVEKTKDNEKLAIEYSKAPVSEELNIFKSIKDLNWAWIFEKEDGTWVQFECLICMLLEAKWCQPKSGLSHVFQILIES